MTDPRDLISAATPLPWRDDGYMDHGHTDTFGCNIVAGEPGDYADRVTWAGQEGLEGSVPDHADAALIVYAVNNLPALLDVADALERLLDTLDSMQHSAIRDDDVAWAVLLGGNGAGGDARAALARLRENQP